MMHKLLQYFALVAYFGLTAGVVLADGTFSEAWEAKGAYALLRDMGGLLGALVTLAAGVAAYRAARIPHERQEAERRIKLLEAGVIYKRYVDKLTAVIAMTEQIVQNVPMREKPTEDQLRLTGYISESALSICNSSPTIDDVSFFSSFMNVNYRLVMMNCVQKEIEFRRVLEPVAEVFRKGALNSRYDALNIAVIRQGADFVVQGADRAAPNFYTNHGIAPPAEGEP